MNENRKYYVVEIVTYIDAKKDSYAIYAYNSKTSAENRTEAVAAYHGKMRTNMMDSTCATAQCMVIDDYNHIEAQDRFERNAEEVTP